tara:strand:+ start:176 stop:313 length:138 start_codon:yes stop_codon:yes gene_type:complete
VKPNDALAGIGNLMERNFVPQTEAAEGLVRKATGYSFEYNNGPTD